MKHILILLGRYKPQMSANSICVDKIIDQLPTDEYKISCICYEDGLYFKDEKITEYKISRGLVQGLLYRLENKKGGGFTFFNKILLLAAKCKQIPFLVCWPWNDPVYTRRVYSAAKKIYREDPYDMVIAVHMPISSLVVGHRLKEDYPQVKYIPYFLDSLSGGRPIRICSEKWNLKKKLGWERKLLANADTIVAMEASRAHHEQYNVQQAFYDRFLYLDIPLLSIHKLTTVSNPFDASKINILFCGTANYPMRDLRYFCDLAKELENSNLCFTIIGQSNCAEYFQGKNVTYIPFLEHKELEKYYTNADVLLNFGVRTPSAISGKIFEYMSYGKPIISTYSIDAEACIPYLRQYPCSYLLDERTDVKVQAKVMLKFVLEHQHERIEPESLKELFFKNTPDAFVQLVLNPELERSENK